jgi:hypothetical protein
VQAAVVEVLVALQVTAVVVQEAMLQEQLDQLI